MNYSRRQFLKLGAKAGLALALAPAGCRLACSTGDLATKHADTGAWVNDVHSQLNLTHVRRIVRPESLADLTGLARSAAADGHCLSVAGGRHAAGGQQFVTDGVLVDTRGLNRVINLDTENGIVEAEAGIIWPKLMDELTRRQGDRPGVWGIVQKQGVDRMTLGGSVGSNIHGNGLGHQPIVAEVESFVLVDANGIARRCSRQENAELFSLAVGGYGLFGMVASLRLRLARRKKLRASVRMADITEVVPMINRCQAEGALYGDWHYSPDTNSKDFLRRGVLATYQPLAPGQDVPVTEMPAAKSENWVQLAILAHRDRGAAFNLFGDNEVKKDGTVVWSDTFQLDQLYADNYHAIIDRELKAPVPATESLVEFYVPREALGAYLDDVRADFLRNETTLLYGTVRFVERDATSFLPWARQSIACIVYNFHVVHDEVGRRNLAATYRRMIDLAARHGGTFYLTYHCFATRSQVEHCHPRMSAFLHAKRRHDPREIFQSNWYHYYKTLFANSI